MQHTDQVRIQSNEPSVQIYFGHEFANQSGFPLAPDMTAVVHLVPDRAVVIVPADQREPYPIELARPEDTTFGTANPPYE